MTVANMKSGFRANGIFPFNPSIPPEETFSQSIPTVLPPPETTAIQNVSPVNPQSLENNSLQSQLLQVIIRISDDSDIDCNRVHHLIERALKIWIHLNFLMIQMI